jgi:hypothetical protein
VNIPNAFIGRKDQSSQAEIVSALGPNVSSMEIVLAKIWLVAAFKLEKTKYRVPVSMQRVFSPGICVRRSRGQSSAARSPPKKVKVEPETARCYSEGTGISLIVKRSNDLLFFCKLTPVKLAN